MGCFNLRLYFTCISDTVGSLFPSPGDLPSLPGIEPRSPTLQAESLPAETQGKPKNTGMGSLSLLQQIFLTQGLNPGLPLCRQTFYPLSHKGSPLYLSAIANNTSNMDLQISLSLVSFLWGMYSEVELLDQVVVLCLVF